MVTVSGASPTAPAAGESEAQITDAGRRTGVAKDLSKDEHSRKALSYSKFYGGKVGTTPKVPVRSLDDFSIWYTPGVAAVSLAVQADPESSFDYTGRWNTIAVVSDGSRVLGLGNVGPESSLPVMEGKALIYNYLGGVNAFALPVRVKDEEHLIDVVKALEPSLGGVNLEDIESPKCFEVLDRLRAEMRIPVWHDDQQGTAGVSLAGLYNALELTGRRIEDSKIVLFGSGAANVAAARLFMEAGADAKEILVVDRKGILHPERDDIDQLSVKNKWKYELALTTNGDKVTGGLSEALKGADVLIAAAGVGPDLVKKEQVASMNRRAIVFLMANPIPEMWPDDAIAAGAEVVATGRSDYPNQVNNSLLFPAIFRGALDARSRTITDTMVIAAAKELARHVRDKGLTRNHILPTMTEWEVYPQVAAAVADAAVREGHARRELTRDEFLKTAMEMIQRSRMTMDALTRSGVIAEPPEQG